MDANELLKEMERVANAFKAPDQFLELDIQRVVNTLRSQAKVPPVYIEALEHVLHHPNELVWTRMPEVSQAHTRYEPRPVELEFFSNMIRTVADGARWEVPSTGQVYKIDQKLKTFTLVRDSERDAEDWHGKNKACLAALGWRMIDKRATAVAFQAQKGAWSIVVSDFPIEEQENSKTPGENFPAGSRGQDAFATLVDSHGVFIRLGHIIGHDLIKHTAPDFGTAKYVAVLK